MNIRIATAARQLNLFPWLVAASFLLLSISLDTLAGAAQETPPALAPVPARPATPPPPNLTADQAAERARQQTGGRLISIRPRADGYWVRMLSARGEVRELWIPATSP
ncbi:PepSY domain-containing protein [Rhabdochromatium marinum]|uniref:PepSY domain-containing protein n=1 Tax=Rhabdochromatium marinum TaxID=48729 RepID=UPI0019056F7E|nr:hypothetical protein [Rhabdochromatium marinum]MBK1648708.1 hypothetical protein [Rhabdochromatium marinum]